MKQPEISKTQNGLDLVKFTIACNRIKRQNEEKERTDFISCEAWRNNALYLSKYCNKGDSLVVVGRYAKDSFQGRDGNTIYRDYITVSTVKKMASSQSTAQPKSECDGFDVGGPDVDPNDLPF